MAGREGITELLLERRGDDRVVDRLFPLIYDELRRIAHVHLRGERTGHTLGTTALVHEAYIKMVDIRRVEWRDRVHFLAMASRAMRRILVDHARSHLSARRGGGRTPVELDESTMGDEEAADLVALDDALRHLTELNPRLTEVVEHRFFAGMTEEETAEALGVTARTVRRDWVKARGLLRYALDVEGSDAPGPEAAEQSAD